MLYNTCRSVRRILRSVVSALVEDSYLYLRRLGVSEADRLRVGAREAEDVVEHDHVAVDVTHDWEHLVEGAEAGR
jgi:hypothetical protein